MSIFIQHLKIGSFENDIMFLVAILNQILTYPTQLNNLVMAMELAKPIMPELKFGIQMA